MRIQHSVLIMVVFLVRVSVCAAATLTLNVRHRESGSTSINVFAGTAVSYEIVGMLDNASDNDGLALWGADVTFGGSHGSISNQSGSMANPGGIMTAFDYPNGVTNPPYPPGSYGGTNNGVSLLQVGGGQNTIGNTAANAPFPIGSVVKDVGVNPQVLARGTYLVPSASSLGNTHVISLTNCFANVIDDGEAGPDVFNVSRAVIDCANAVLTMTVCSAIPEPLNSAVSRKNCDMTISLGSTRTSEPRFGGISRLVFDFAYGPYDDSITIEEDISCPGPPTYVPYTGSASSSCTVANGIVTCTFSPPLENARAYRFTLDQPTGSCGQPTRVELRGLVGDITSDGLVNAADRSAVVGVWTGPGFTCSSDLNSSGSTNAADRSAVVGAWTNPAARCAP